MILTIAWRNLWRNKRRSIIILMSIIIGVVALILADTISMGMIRQMLFNRVGAHVGHIQIHRKGFQDNPVIQNSIERPAEIETVLQKEQLVRHYSPRIITFGLLSSATNSTGVNIIGVQPAQESLVTNIVESIREGNYLSGPDREILISTRIAEKLEVGLGDKVVAMASRPDGSVGSEAFRVVGLYETYSSEFDQVYVYIPISMAREMLGLANELSEFVILTDNLNRVDALQQQLRELLPGEYEVLSYKDILPLLVMQIEIYDELIWIYYVIIGLGLVFGIVNTMLMSVFERIHELGVLQAIGMPGRKMFVMVLLEALLLGIAGTIMGAAAGLLIYWPLSNSGIDLSMFAESLTAFGTGAIIYPQFTFNTMINVMITVPFISVLGAIYPAIKAIRFQPVEAIRYV